MKILNIVYSILIYFFALTMSAFIAFSIKENGDFNVIFFGTMIYAFFALIFSLLFALSMFLFQSLQGKIFNRISLFSANVILIIIFALQNANFEIYNWKFNSTEFTVLNLIIFICSLICWSKIYKSDSIQHSR